MQNLLLVLLFAVYEPQIPKDILHEALLRGASFKYYTTRFTIPLNFIEEDCYNCEILKKYSPFINSPFVVNFYVQKDSTTFLLFYPRVHFRSGHWGLVIEPFFKTGKAPGWPYHEWEGFLYGAYSRAFAYYQKDPWMILIGRTKLQLNLEGLFSEEDPPFEMLFVNYKKKIVHFAWWFGQFDPVYTQDLSQWYEANKLYDRFVSGHVLEVLYKKISLSFAEVNLFYSRTNFPDLYFLNPFMLYHVRALDSREGGEHNTFWILAGNLWLRKFSLHGEFIVDDMQYRQVKFVPPKIAWITRGYIIDFPLNNSISGVEYRGVTRWTFTHGIPILYWKNRYEVMGYFDENDFDEIIIFTRKHLNEKFNIRWEIKYRRKGEASVNDPDLYWLPSDYPHDYFLTGVVERILGFANTFEFLGDIYNIQMEMRVESIKNHNHEPGHSATDFGFSLFFSWRI